jgi:hypothetical protein
MADWATQQVGNSSRSSELSDSPWYDDGPQSALARIPADGDRITSVAHDLNVDADLSVGGSAAEGTEDAITVTGGDLTIAEDITLTVRGDTQVNNGNRLIMDLGSTFKFDSSQATNPTDQHYYLKLGSGYYQVVVLDCNGTSAKHCTITSQAGGGNGSILTRSYGGLTGEIQATYADFSNLGSATVEGIYIDMPSPDGFFHDCTFDACGQVRLFGGHGTHRSEFLDCYWTNSLDRPTLFLADVGPSATPGYFYRCSLDEQIKANTNTWRFEDSYFHDGLDGGDAFDPPSWTGNFMRHAGTDSQGQLQVKSVMSDTYVFQAGTHPNGRAFKLDLSDGDVTLSGCIIEHPDGAVGDFVLDDAEAGANKATITGCILLPNSSGAGPGGFLNLLSNHSTETFEVYHNTVVSTDVGETGVAGWGETSPGVADTVTAVKSNLIWTPNGETAGAKSVRRNNTSTPTQDVISPGGWDYNWGWNLAVGSEGNGFHDQDADSPDMFSVVPTDSNGGSGDPLFVDSTRNLASWGQSEEGTDGSVGAALAVLQANPTKIMGLRRWVIEGFTPRNIALKDAGHDGETIGAVAFMTGWATQQAGDWSRSSEFSDSPWYDNGVQSSWAGIPGVEHRLSDLAHALNVDVDTIVGISPAEASNFGWNRDWGVTDPDPAINWSAGSLTLAQDVTFTVRGDVDRYTTTPSLPVTMGAGSSFILDSSQAAAPGSTQYRANQCKFTCNGTEAKPCTINGNGGGAAANGRLHTQNASATTGIIATWTTFKNLGEAADTDGVNMRSSPVSLIDCRVEDSAPLWMSHLAEDEDLILRRLTITGSLGAVSIEYIQCDPKTTATRDIDDLVVDKAIRYFGPGGATVDNCIFGGGWGVLNSTHFFWEHMKNCFTWLPDSNAGGGRSPVNTVLFQDSFVYAQYAGNQHYMSVGGPTHLIEDRVFDGIIWDNEIASGSGDCILGQSPATKTVYVRNCIVCKGAGTLGVGALTSLLGNADTTMSFEHNTHWGHAVVGETYTGHAGMLTAFKNNLYLGTDYKLTDYAGGSTVEDLVTAANCDYNSGYQATAGSNGKGYNKLEFSSGTPGDNDIDVDPQCVDDARGLAAWDAYLGGPGTADHALAEMSKLNDPDFDPRYTVLRLTTWVKAGFAVQERSLVGAGDDGETIGAVPSTDYVSAAAGDWSDPTTWTPNGIPGPNDRITDLAHALNVDVSAIIGDSPVEASAFGFYRDWGGTDPDPVINWSGSGSLTLAEDVTLTLRGDIDKDTTSVVLPVTMGAGSSLIIDSSLAAAPGSTQYRTNQCKFTCNGTQVKPCTINGNGGGAAANGIVWTEWLTSNTAITATWTTFKNLGEAADELGLYMRVGDVSMTDCRVEDSAGIGIGGLLETSDLILERFTVKGSLTSYSIQSIGAEYKTTGIRRIDRLVLDKAIQYLGPGGATIDNSIFNGAWSGLTSLTYTWEHMKNCFMWLPDSNSGGGWGQARTVLFQDCFVYAQYAGNQHYTAVGLTGTLIEDRYFDGIIWDNELAGGSGDCILAGSPAGKTTYVRNCIVTKGASGGGAGTLITLLGDADTTVSMEHNTHWNGAAVGETYAGHAGMLSSYRGNLYLGAAYKLHDSGVDDSVPDLIAAADCDYNSGYQATTGSNGKGYDHLEFSSGTPGDNDLDEDPQCVDDSVGLATWDASLGGPGTGDNAYAEMAKLNDPDFDPRYTMSNLMAYMRENYRPLNSAMATAAHDGTTMGAVAFATGGKTTVRDPVADPVNELVRDLVY